MDFASKFNIDSWVDWNVQYGNVVHDSTEVDEDDIVDECSTNKIGRRNDDDEDGMPTNNFSVFYDESDDYEDDSEYLPNRKMTDPDIDEDQYIGKYSDED